MRNEVKQLKQINHEEEIIKALEKWLDDLKLGKEKARTAVLVWRDGEEETIGKMECGLLSGASTIMGMLNFASAMVFDRSKRVN